MASDLIRDLQKRGIVLSPSVKAEILHAESIANGFVAIVAGISRATNALFHACKTLTMNNAVASEN